MNEQLLKKHFEQAPRMEPQDAVKLAFQSAFGCGHLLPAQEDCARRIQAEMASVPQRETPLFTPIGNGLCRLELASPDARRLGAGRIARMMLVTDEIVRARKKNRERFEAALALMQALALQGRTPFSAGAFEAYLRAYRAQGCPVVSHTPAYREAYLPAYRVVLADLALLTPVLLSGRSVIVLDGPCGSGKTTLSGLLGRMCGATPIPMDDFFLPFDLRTPERLAQPGGNVHYERFEQEVLRQLAPGKPVCWNRFHCADGTLIPRSIPACDTVIIEGSYSHHPYFRPACERLQALRVFVSVEPGEQLRRIRLRDPGMLQAFETRWIPLEKKYFEAYDIQSAADVVLDSLPW